MVNKYIFFQPQVVGSVGEEWRQCLDQITKTKLSGYKLVKLNLFTDMPDYDTYIKLSREIGKTIHDVFSECVPSFNITVHPPENPWKIVVEAGYMNSVSSEIVSKVWHSIPYIVRSKDSIKEVWAGGLGASLFHDDTRKAATSAFDQMRAILGAEQMTFDHIVRQWNYIGNILEVKNDLQNYQIFNEVRSDNYQKYRKVHSYPAATGIGMKYGGVILDFCAVQAFNNLKIIAIDNPDQIRPYDYGQQVLKGKPLGSKGLKQPPQFERAVYLVDYLSSTLFVSGTASIVGQDTIGVNDVEKQTIVTLENIGKLTDSERIRHLTGNSDADAGELILLRVYIKKQDDFTKVKAICSQRFPGIPAIYIEADVCRDDLLVEIEAEYLKKNVSL